MSCKKSAFETRELAVGKLQEILTSGEIRSKTPKRAYKCTECGKWHLTAFSKQKYVTGIVNGEFQEKKLLSIAEQFAKRKGWKLE